MFRTRLFGKLPAVHENRPFVIRSICFYTRVYAIMY